MTKARTLLTSSSTIRIVGLLMLAGVFSNALPPWRRRRKLVHFLPA